MLSMALVFVHLLAASMALGAIVATDLRLLSKLAEDRVRIAPPNAFVARIVAVALGLLWASGLAIVALGLAGNPDYLANPKLQAKIGLVALLTANAVALHRITFPRLARGKRVARWRTGDWLAVAVPVALSNTLWLFAAFLGIARPWNHTVPLEDVLAVAVGLYAVVQAGVFAILGIAGSATEASGRGRRLRRLLAAVGNLGTPVEAPLAEPARPSRRRRARPPETLLPVPARPSLRLVENTAAGALGAAPARRVRGAPA
jgi:hypothetical protein